MNGWDTHHFAQRVAHEMQRQRSTTTWKLVGLRQVEIDIDGYVILTLTTTSQGLAAEYQPRKEVRPDDHGLIDNARSFFSTAFDTVTREMLGLQEKVPSQV